jgi:hypothetical protein
MHLLAMIPSILVVMNVMVGLHITYNMDDETAYRYTYQCIDIGKNKNCRCRFLPERCHIKALRDFVEG